MRIKILLIFSLLALIIADQVFAQNDLEVTGIMQGGEALAVVNGKVVKKGDKMGKAEVIAVGQDSVDFKIENEVIRKPIKKTENFKPQPKKDTISILFAGLEIKDMDKTNVFELKDDGDCSINIVSRSEVEPVIAKFYQKDNTLFWFIANKTDLPIELNYYGDEYYLMDKQGKAYKFPITDIKYYPSYLNPNDTWNHYIESVDWFEKRYLKLDEIIYIYCLLDGRTRAIVLKPYPPLQNK